MKAILLATSIAAQPLVNSDVLEPSVIHEVEHALACAPTNLVGMTHERVSDGLAALGVTNGLDRTQMAIRLVSRQSSDGHWRIGTNDYSVVAVEFLKRLLH